MAYKKNENFSFTWKSKCTPHKQQTIMFYNSLIFLTFKIIHLLHQRKQIILSVIYSCSPGRLRLPETMGRKLNRFSYRPYLQPEPTQHYRQRRSSINLTSLYFLKFQNSPTQRSKQLQSTASAMPISTLIHENIL